MRRGKNPETPLVEILPGPLCLLPDEDDRPQLREQRDEIVDETINACSMLRRRYPARAVPARDDVPDYCAVARQLCFLHEVKGMLGRRVVVVARNEARNRCHRSGLLEQEKEIGVRAAIKRIEVWELPVRMRPSQLRDKIRKRHHMWLVKHLLAKRNSFGRTKRTSAIFTSNLSIAVRFHLSRQPPPVWAARVRVLKVQPETRARPQKFSQARGNIGRSITARVEVNERRPFSTPVWCVSFQLFSIFAP
jgi:hypothetical protein